MKKETVTIMNEPDNQQVETDPGLGKPVLVSRSDEARAHADVVSVRQDLVYAHWATKKLLDLVEISKGKKPDANEVSTYWTSALIAYARCFSTGKRLGLKAEIFKGLPGDPLGAHKYFIDQRSKLIAHSVNPFEQIQAGFVTDTSGKVVGVTELSVKLVAPDKDGCETLLNLIKVAIQFVAKEAENTKARLLAQGQSLSIAEIKALPVMLVTVPSPDQSGESR